MKKLVELSDLYYLGRELFEIKLHSSGHIRERIARLENFVNEKIINELQISKNEIKKVAYMRMKTAKTPEENRQWYEFYKAVDEN